MHCMALGFIVFGWHLVYDFAGPDLHLVARVRAYSNYYDNPCWLLYPAILCISRTIVQDELRDTLSRCHLLHAKRGVTLLLSSPFLYLILEWLLTTSTITTSRRL